jgi:hypothetical protein
MSIPGIGKDLHWWHALTGVSAAALVACITRDWPNGATIAAGFCAIGIGEWMNHPLQTSVIPLQAVITGHPRKNYPLGIAFVIAGGIAAVVGAIRALI